MTDKGGEVRQTVLVVEWEKKEDRIRVVLDLPRGLLEAAASPARAGAECADEAARLRKFLREWKARPQ